jgi:L,D-peptidoglycan transpeptidase YkuD (ErfK/YbiS/YcfS/YnhG family)
MHLTRLLAVSALAAGCATAPAPAAETVRGATPDPAGAALQAVVVTTPHWDATDGTLRRYARAAPGQPWYPVAQPVPTAVGRTGLAWGVGLHPQQEGAPQKREGDGRAPAGVFRLSSAFGYAPAEEVQWVRLPYHEARPSVKCVDDGASPLYNQRVDVDTLAAPPAWTSHEEMRRDDLLYQWGVWVDHNTGPAVPGRGSCIFLHVWRAPGVPTAGCSAMEDAHMVELLRWLDPAAAPVLVQLPEHEYDRLRRDWRLP